jgi:hypothetical protein
VLVSLLVACPTQTQAVSELAGHVPDKTLKNLPNPGSFDAFEAKVFCFLQTGHGGACILPDNLGRILN